MEDIMVYFIETVIVVIGMLIVYAMYNYQKESKGK